MYTVVGYLDGDQVYSESFMELGLAEEAQQALVSRFSPVMLYEGDPETDRWTHLKTLKAPASKPLQKAVDLLLRVCITEEAEVRAVWDASIGNYRTKVGSSYFLCYDCGQIASTLELIQHDADCRVGQALLLLAGEK